MIFIKNKILNGLIFFLILTLILISFAACSANTDGKVKEDSASENTTTLAEQETVAEDIIDRSVLDDLGEFDFGGYEFKIYNRVNDGWANSRLDFEELTGEAYNDAVFTRNRNLESRFNITINMIEYTDQGKIRSHLLAGTNDYDLYTGRNAEAFTHAQNGLINSINDFEYIDLDKAYWDDFLTKQLTVANKKFFAVGAFNFSNLDMSYVLVFNKRLFQDYGLENPFDLVKSGTWTLDKFAEMSKAGTLDINGDGQMTRDDAWGYVSRSNEVLPGFWIGAGVKAAEKDSDDIPQNMMGTEKFINVISKIFEITHENGVYFHSGEAEGKTMFLGDKVLFNDCSPFELLKLRAMETDFGILPYPKFDEVQDAYYTRIGGCELFFTAKSASKEDLDRTSIILEAMACESLKSCVPAYYELMLKTKLARDVESEEIIDIIFANRVFDFVDNLWVGELRDGPLNTMFTSKNNTLVSQNEKLENVFNKKRDSMVEAFMALE